MHQLHKPDHFAGVQHSRKQFVDGACRVILHAHSTSARYSNGFTARATQDDRVESRKAFASFAVVNEEEVLSPERDAAQRALRSVVIKRDEHVVEEDAAFIPLVFGVVGCGGDRAFSADADPSAP